MIPAITGWAIDEIKMGSRARIDYVLLLALGIFVADLGITLISNIGGYYGDQISARLYKLLGNKYYEHLLDLPQRYFDKELSGKIINRLNRSVAQISNFMQMMSNNFLQFIFGTVFALVVVAIYSWQVALLLLMLYLKLLL
jgi:ATP-binding cassette subfamily B protein